MTGRPRVGRSQRYLPSGTLPPHPLGGGSAARGEHRDHGQVLSPASVSLPSGVARGPAVAREEHQRRPIPSPATRDLSHPPTSLFILLWGVGSGAKRGCRPPDHGRVSVVTCGFADRRGRGCGRLSAWLSAGIPAWSTAALSLRDRGRAFVVGGLVEADCCCDRYMRRRTGCERTVMICVDTGSGDRMALGVPTQYRMATTEQMHRVITPEVASSRPGGGWPDCVPRGWSTASPCRRPDGCGCSPPRTAGNSPPNDRRWVDAGPPGPSPIRPPYD